MRKYFYVIPSVIRKKHYTINDTGTKFYVKQRKISISFTSYAHSSKTLVWDIPAHRISDGQYPILLKSTHAHSAGPISAFAVAVNVWTGTCRLPFQSLQPRGTRQEYNRCFIVGVFFQSVFKIIKIICDKIEKWKHLCCQCTSLFVVAVIVCILFFLRNFVQNRSTLVCTL